MSYDPKNATTGEAAAFRIGLLRAADLVERVCEEIMARTATPIRRAKEDAHTSEQCHQEGRWHAANDCREDIIGAIRAEFERAQ